VAQFEIQTEYYVSMLTHRFVSLRVACVKSYHVRPNVERDVTLHRQQEVIQTDGSLGYRNVPFIIYLFHNFSNILNLKTTDLH